MKNTANTTRFKIKFDSDLDVVSVIYQEREYPLPEDQWLAFSDAAEWTCRSVIENTSNSSLLGKIFSNTRKKSILTSAFYQFESKQFNLSDFKNVDLFGNMEFQKSMNHLNESIAKKFTVISSVADEGTIVIRHVMAENALYSFGVVAKDERDKGASGLNLDFLVALDGWRVEGDLFNLPGKQVVNCETVQEQNDVFCPRYIDQNIPKTKLKNKP